MRTNLSIILICLLVSFGAFAQHNTSELPTSISETGTQPDNSAMLDIQSSGKGVLVPRMTYTEIRSIPSPAEGLMVYDTDSHCLRIFNGSKWDCLYEKTGVFRGQQSISTLGGSGSQFGRDIAADALGNIYVIGGYLGTTVFGNTTLPDSGGENVFIVKYDSSGAVVWAKAVTNSSYFDFGNSIAASQNGDVYVTGSIEDPNTSNREVFVAKYNTSGTLQWMQTAGSSGSDGGNAIDVDSNGDTYVTGYFQNTLIFHDGTTLVSNGGNDIFIAKYSNVGALLWAKNAGGNSYDVGEGLVLDNAGNIYLTGRFEGNASFDAIGINSTGNYDVFVAKYDPNGNAQWVKSAGGSGPDQGYEITLDDAGNVYVVGSYNGQANFDNTQLQATGGHDAFIAVYDNQGNFMWAKQVAGGGSGDFAYGVTTDTNGNIYVTGSFVGLTIFDDIVLKGSSSSSDAFIVKYDNTGNLEWTQHAGNDNSSSHDAGTGAITTPNGDVYITGYIIGIAVFGETFVIGEGSHDVFVIKHSP